MAAQRSFNHNEILGTPGRDELVGTSNSDRIVGLQGADKLSGGSGNDRFIYNGIRDRGDTITDFEVGKDTNGDSTVWGNAGTRHRN